MKRGALDPLVPTPGTVVDSPLEMKRMPSPTPLLAALALLGASALAAPAAAPTSHRADGPDASAPVPLRIGTQDAPPEPEGERPLRRLLHLCNGSVLRGPSRQVDDTWAIRLGDSWERVPAALIERAALERDVLREARRRETDLPRDDLAARVEHARWLADEGLYTECLEALDRVLEADPDRAEALELIDERPVRIALPSVRSDREAFYPIAARTGPAGRELAVDELKRVEDRESLRAELDAEVVDPSSARRAFALLALRRLFPGEDVMALVRRAVLDRDSAVRAEAARGLRDAGDEGVAQPVVRALSSSHSILRKHAAEALGIMSYPATVEPLVAALASGGAHRPAASHIFSGTQTAYVQDFDVEVAQGEAIAGPRVNVLLEGAVLDARVLSTHDSTLSTERRAMRNALSRITGVEVGSRRDAWSRWWEAEGESWLRSRLEDGSDS